MPVRGSVLILCNGNFPGFHLIEASKRKKVKMILFSSVVHRKGFHKIPFFTDLSSRKIHLRTSSNVKRGGKVSFSCGSTTSLQK